MPPKKKENEVSELTQDEINDFLKNSILIPSDQWQTLPINSYISYFKEDGKFIKGGYIKLIFTKKDPKTDENSNYLIYGTKIDKYNNDKYYKEFTINLSNIKEIYKKIDNSALIEYQIIKNNINKIINTTNTKIEEMVSKMSNIEKKIIKLEENHYKTIKLIKNLHNIKNLDNIQK
jgi:hypothetical protein